MGVFEYEIPFLNAATYIMRSVFIRCFCEWVGEEAKGEDRGSWDYDCVVEWWGGAKRAESGYVMVGGSKNSGEWISCRCFLYGYSYSLL